MPKCHRCPWDVPNKIKSGEFENTDWSEVPCSKCKFDEFSDNHGKSYVSFDFLPEHEQVQFMEEESDVLNLLYERSILVLREIFHQFIVMDRLTREIVLDRFKGNTYKDIAKKHGISTSGVFKRLKKVILTWPMLGKAISINKNI